MQPDCCWGAKSLFDRIRLSQIQICEFSSIFREAEGRDIYLQ
jgi:hypothetical protein